MYSLEIYDRWERESRAYESVVRCRQCQQETRLQLADVGCDDQSVEGTITRCCHSDDYEFLYYDEGDEDIE